MSAHQSLLAKIYLFKEMTPEELDKIQAISTTAVFAPGDEIFSEKDTAVSLYIIKFGSVRIQQAGKGDNPIEVATLGTGSHFGEMAFVDGEKRSATVVAIEKSEVVTIEFGKLTQLLDENPKTAVKFYRALAHFLCGRLRLTTTDLSFAREKNLRHF